MPKGVIVNIRRTSIYPYAVCIIVDIRSKNGHGACSLINSRITTRGYFSVFNNRQTPIIVKCAIGASMANYGIRDGAGNIGSEFNISPIPRSSRGSTIPIRIPSYPVILVGGEIYLASRGSVCSQSTIHRKFGRSSVELHDGAGVYGKGNSRGYGKP